MPPRTTRAKASTVAPLEAPSAKLIPDEQDAERLFVLPKKVSAEARIVSIASPATSTLGRYLFCPVNGLYEFTKVAAPRNDPRSCLLAYSCGEVDTDSPSTPSGSDVSQHTQTGYVLEQADVFLATPTDPLFLLTPLFSSSRAMFKPADDYFDQLSDSSFYLAQMLRNEPFKNELLQRIGAVSETQDLGDGEVVYRPQLNLLLDVLIKKARRMTGDVFGASLGETFVQKQLEVPIAPIQRNMQEGHDKSMVPGQEELKSSVRSEVPLHVTQLMRQRVALDYILSSYVAPPLRSELSALLSTSNRVDSVPLEDHLKQVKSAQAEIYALRALSDNISRKRSGDDDDEAAEARVEKKRKKEEEEKRKKAATRASKELKKVDTSGMKKLSSFFTKAAPTTRSQTMAS